MFNNISKSSSRFYQIGLMMMVLLILGITAYFWKVGYTDGTRRNNLHESFYILESYVDKNEISEIKRSYQNERYDLSLSRLKDLDKSFSQVNEIVSDSTYKIVKKNILTLEKTLKSNIGVAKSKDVLKVISGKIISFNRFVRENKWPTLTRMSQRLLSLTQNANSRRSLQRLPRAFKKDLAVMKKVTMNSILTDDNKRAVVSRLNKFSKELELIDRNVGKKQKINNLFSKVDESIQNWMDTINPNLSFERIKQEQVGTYFIYALIAISIFSLLLLIAGFVYSKFFQRNNSLKFELAVKEYMHKVMTDQNFDELKGCSSDFLHFSKKISAQMNHKISFASMFKENLPFATVVLNKNLKVTWANQAFVDDWNISAKDIESNFLSWDYLVKFTNLQDQDPVVDSIKNNIAGIYQIRLRVSESDKGHPYEMYVSPSSDGENIMLFFYSLYNVQDTIEEHASSMISPIVKTLDHIENYSFTPENVNLLSKEYGALGIDNLLQKFTSVHMNIFSQKDQLVKELSLLQDQLREVTLLYTEKEQSLYQNQETFKNLQGHIRQIKDLFIKLTGHGDFVSDQYSSSVAYLSKVLKQVEETHNNSKVTSNLLDEIIGSVPKLISLKSEYKKLKIEVAESRGRVSHSISQLIHLRKKITNKAVLERFNQQYEKIMTDFKVLDDSSTFLDKKLVTLEVSISKIQMIVDNLEKKAHGESLSKSGSFIKEALVFFEESKSNLGQISSSRENFENDLVDKLKLAYQEADKKDQHIPYKSVSDSELHLYS